jgi:ESCRT-II complex subunit VPS25
LLKNCNFRRQAHQETWAKQCTIWSDIILQFCKTKSLFRISIEDTVNQSNDLTEGSRTADSKNTEKNADIPLFHNKAIQRRLAPDVQRDILDSMVKKGQAAWRKNPENLKEISNVCYIYWKSLNEWSDLIYEWVPPAILLKFLNPFLFLL